MGSGAVVGLPAALPAVCAALPGRPEPAGLPGGSGDRSGGGGDEGYPGPGALSAAPATILGLHQTTGGLPGEPRQPRLGRPGRIHPAKRAAADGGRGEQPSKCSPLTGRGQVTGLPAYNRLNIVSPVSLGTDSSKGVLNT